MSIGRRKRRNGKHNVAKISPHTKFLMQLLTEYFNFLEREDKPSDEEVRETFIAYDKRWVQYCNAHQFAPRATLLFNQQVARAWRSRYAKQKSKTEN